MAATRTAREDQGIAEKVIARMRMIGGGRATCGGGARKIRAASGSVNCTRLGASVRGLLDSNRSMLQSCTIIYNNKRWRAVLIEMGFAGRNRFRYG